MWNFGSKDYQGLYTYIGPKKIFLPLNIKIIIWQVLGVSSCVLYSSYILWNQYDNLILLDAAENMIWAVPTNYSQARASMGSLIEGKVLVHYSSKKSGQTKYGLTNRMYSTV